MNRRSLHDANFVIVQRGGNTPGWKLVRHPDSITLRYVYEVVVEKLLFASSQFAESEMSDWQRDTTCPESDPYEIGN